MTKFITPNKLIELSKDTEDNTERIEKLNDILKRDALLGARETYIYDRELYNDYICSELMKSGFSVTKEPQDFLGNVCLHIAW